MDIGSEGTATSGIYSYMHVLEMHELDLGLIYPNRYQAG